VWAILLVTSGRLTMFPTVGVLKVAQLMVYLASGIDRARFMTMPSYNIADSGHLNAVTDVLWAVDRC